MVVDSQVQEIMELTELQEEDILERNNICSNISKTFARHESGPNII